MAFNPSTYRVAVKSGKHKLVLETRQWTDPEPGQIVIKTLACGVCHTDIMAPVGQIPGHEIVGDVVAVHESETLWKVGDRVGSGWHAAVVANSRFVTIVNGLNKAGGYGEYVTLRCEGTARIPKEMSPADAGIMMCAGITVANSLRNVNNIRPGDVVLVSGLGGLAHLAVQFSKKSGYYTVVSSRGTSKKDLALELGADQYIDSETQDVVAELAKLGGAKVVMGLAPSGEALTKLIPALGKESTLLLLAIPDDEMKIAAFPLISRRAAVLGWPAGSSLDAEEITRFAHRAGIRGYTQEYSLDQVQEAYDAMLNGTARFRAVLSFK
ncbi:hypothetical protein OIV83_005742 [Microbotryomycetes sp. JL201]|nr:hypothetical protein OIV83_005742 [Microbotryomycetes sp. JL201]